MARGSYLRAGQHASRGDPLIRFTESNLAGAHVIDLERHHDERGFFARSFCEQEFEQHGISPHFPQCNISVNARAGTLRGMHFNVPKHAEAKLVRCTAGGIYDVIVDLRRDSLTFSQWLGVELTAENRKMLFVPEGFAHGFVTLSDDTEVFYHMGSSYVADAARGFRWNDPRFDIAWPRDVSVISERDQTYPDFDVSSLADSPK